MNKHFDMFLICSIIFIIILLIVINLQNSSHKEHLSNVITYNPNDINPNIKFDMSNYHVKEINDITEQINDTRIGVNTNINNTINQNHDIMTKIYDETDENNNLIEDNNGDNNFGDKCMLNQFPICNSDILNTNTKDILKWYLTHQIKIKTYLDDPVLQGYNILKYNNTVEPDKGVGFINLETDNNEIQPKPNDFIF